MKPTAHKITSFTRIGKWVEKKTLAEILVCACGNKYIKTRKNQTVCVRCLAQTLERGA